MPCIEMIGRPNALMGWDGQRAYLAEDLATGTPPPTRLDGVAAAVQLLDDGSARLFRDRLGIAKLFWARSPDGTLRFSARPIELIRAGHRLDDIAAVPRGYWAELDPRGHVRHETIFALPKPADGNTTPSLEEIGGRIRRGIDNYLAAIAKAYRDRPVFVCLSGGLDSSTVAVLARRHFPDMTAVSFDLSGPNRGSSEDRIAARRLADDLGIGMIESTVTVDKLLSYLDTVLVEGIDWRDFNVHCALVNAAIAETIAEEIAGNFPCGNGSPLVITGDLANEFLVDYTAESYRGETYYALPRLSPSRLQSILLQGLETSHREVGVFEAWGIDVVQPYAVAADAYLSLPPDFLADDARKNRLVREIVGNELPNYIYDRPKVRAQIGGTDTAGGTLAACIDNGIDEAFLRHRFAELHDINEEEALDRFIRAGRYRSAVPTPAEVTHESV